MNKLEKLIAKLCPNGVDYKPLGELLDYKQPTKYIVRSTEYDDSYKTPVLTAGQTFILGYTNEEDGHYMASKESPVIIFDDFTTATQWVDFEFKVKSSAMKILTIHDAKVADIRFVYYAIQCIKYTPGEHSRHWIEKYSKFEIPLPPLPVQEEIVRMLDGMAGLIDALEQELAARKQQYEWCRDKLLKMTNGGGYCKLTLGEIVDIVRGDRITKKQISDGGEYPVISGGTSPMGYYTAFNRESNTITVAQYGMAGFVNWQSRRFWANDVCYCLQPGQDVNCRFLYYALKQKQEEIYKLKTNAIPACLPRERLAAVLLTLPPLAEQRRIVEILDKFDKLCNSTMEGLPGEIALRKKQFEFCRDKFLTFKKAS